MKDEIVNPVSSIHTYVGKTVTVRNQEYERNEDDEIVLDDDRNPIHEEPDEVEVIGNVSRSGDAEFQQRADSLDMEVDRLVYVKEDVDVTTGQENHQLASRIVDDGEVIRARDIFEEGNGLLRIHGVVE